MGIEEEYNFNIYVQPILNQLHPNLKINVRSKSTLNLMLHDVARKLCSNVLLIMSNPRNVTVSVKTMQESVLMTLTGDLKKHAISAAEIQ